MSVALWRIATDTPGYTSDDLSGEGARRTGGRWNSKGNAAVYTSKTVALACLETLVHLNAGVLPLNRYLVRIDISDKVWAARTVFAAVDLPVGWDAVPHGKVSVDAGDDWLAAGEAALLEIPSVIVPEEANVVINPTHRSSAGLVVTKLRRWSYDPRTQ